MLNCKLTGSNNSVGKKVRKKKKKNLFRFHHKDYFEFFNLYFILLIYRMDRNNIATNPSNNTACKKILIRYIGSCCSW